LRKKMKLILCGDLVPTEATRPAFDKGDIKALMGDTLSVIKSGDFAVANLECALTKSDKAIRKLGDLLKGEPSDAEVIANCGFTHMGLSNNHTLDYGIAGMRDTVEAVKKAGMIPFGYGENDTDSRKTLFIEKDDIKVGIVAVCEHEYTYAMRDSFGANPFDPFDTMEDIALAKSDADYVIVMYHGGKEQCEYPSERLRKACREHSHCIGCRESFKGKEILYGQGNFNFIDEPEDEQWRSGLIAEITLDKGVKTGYIPVVTTETGIKLADPAEKEKILYAFYKRSDILQNTELWLEEWEKFCRSVPYYVDAVKNAFTDVPEGELCSQVFPHYLDCEAHTDVWRTVFKSWHGDKTSGA